MKKKILDIDVDFIGGQGSLTIEEEKALSDFFRKRNYPIKNLDIGKKKSVPKEVKPSI